MVDLHARVGGFGRSRMMIQGISGTSGVWTNVTPGDMILDPDGTPGGATNNYGCQGVFSANLVDLPQRMYMAATYQKLWVSENYGATWTPVTITGSNPFADGRPNMRVAPDGSYLLTTALYPINGLSNGVWKSVDAGATWTRYSPGAPNGDDIGSIDILYSDKTRVLCSSHSDSGGGNYHFYESVDSGATWTDQGAMPNGDAHMRFISADYLLSLGGGDNGSGPGTYRGTRSGSSWPWTWSWSSVALQQHWHSDSQIFIDPVTGYIYTGGGIGIERSTNNGASFSLIESTWSGGIVATDSTIYSSASYATHGTFGPYLQSAPRSPGTSWSDDASGASGSLNNGWIHADAVTDGSRWAIVTGNWNAGAWRYIE